MRALAQSSFGDDWTDPGLGHVRPGRAAGRRSHGSGIQVGTLADADRRQEPLARRIDPLRGRHASTRRPPARYALKAAALASRHAGPGAADRLCRARDRRRHLHRDAAGRPRPPTRGSRVRSPTRDAPSSRRSAANGTPHPFLRVVFDTRVYNDGTARVDVTVENVLDLVGATTVTYDATLTVNGTAFFTKTAGPALLPHALAQDRRRRRHRSPTSRRTSRRSTRRTRFRPTCRSSATRSTSPTGAAYEILREGALERNMPAHSGRQEIAPYPDWTARYLVHKNPTQRAFVLANGDLSGSWPIHMREREAGPRHGVGAERFISVDERPNFWLDDRAADAGWDTMAGTPLPMHEYGNIDPGPGPDGADPRRRAPALDRVRALPADRRSLLRRRDGVLGVLLHAAHLSGRRHAQQHAASSPTTRRAASAGRCATWPTPPPTSRKRRRCARISSRRFRTT